MYERFFHERIALSGYAKDHMHHQRFAGRLEPADLKAVVHNPLCGDELELTIVLGGDPSEGAQRPIQEARMGACLFRLCCFRFIDGREHPGFVFGRGK